MDLFVSNDNVFVDLVDAMRPHSPAQLAETRRSPSGSEAVKTACRVDLDGRMAVARGLASTAGTKQNPLLSPDTPTMVTLRFKPWKTSDSYALC